MYVRISKNQQVPPLFQVPLTLHKSGLWKLSHSDLVSECPLCPLFRSLLWRLSRSDQVSECPLRSLLRSRLWRLSRSIFLGMFPSSTFQVLSLVYGGSPSVMVSEYSITRSGPWRFKLWSRNVHVTGLVSGRSSSLLVF